MKTSSSRSRASSLFLSLAVVVTSTGCAIKTPHLNISRRSVADRAMYFREASPYRLAILPLLDRRPAHEHQGQRPAGMFLLLWNRRVGDYYTGDHVFGGEVSAQLSRQLTEYLNTAHVFTTVDFLPLEGPDAGHGSPTALSGQGPRADYLLGGELQHFFGSQHQNFSMFALPLYFINTFGWQNGKTLPWGRTAIRAYLYDGQHGDIVWQNHLEASHTLPRDTDSMAEAALESFVTVAGRLATELRQLPLDSLQRRESQ